MTRTVTFDSTNPFHVNCFRYIYGGFISGGSVAAQARSQRPPKDGAFDGEIRREAKLLKALKEISKLPPNAKLEDPNGLRILKEGATTLALPQDLFSLLMSYMKQAQWTIGVIDEAVDAVDWLDTATSAP